MTQDTHWLKGNLAIEPLLNQWYAWPLLIPPLSYAMNVCHRHLKIMNSFVKAPQVHETAVQTMNGGPFLDVPATKVDEVKRLLAGTVQRQQRQIGLGNAIKSLDTLLRDKANGTSLESLYPEVPDKLRGFVELTYDQNNQASYRLFESLLYRSDLYDKELQSIALHPVEQDLRPFLLSTPRLEQGQSLHLPLPFEHEGIDELFGARRTAKRIDYLAELLGVTNEQMQIFREFFTNEAPQPVAGYEGSGVRIRYFGHACLLIETSECCILTDPLISYRYDGAAIPRFSYEDLPDKIDYVLITHNHQDHVLFETLLQLRQSIRHIIVPRASGTLYDPSLKLILNTIGFDQVTETTDFDEIPLPGGRLTTLPFLGEHADLDIRCKQSYHLNLKGRSILLLADSNNFEPRLYQNVADELGGIDAVFLGMECDGAPLSWLYGPLLGEGSVSREQDESRRLNACDFDQASEIVATFAPDHVYIYAMGQEPWLSHIMGLGYTAESRPIIESTRLVDDCRDKGIIAERLFGSANLEF